MNGDPNIQLLTARQSRKRPHHEMIDSRSESRSTSPWDYAEPSGSNRGTQVFSNHRPTLPPLPRMRFPGDGYDFRRPVMATASAPNSSPPPPLPHQENVIDLTDEPDNVLSDRATRTPLRQAASRNTRPPRFGRNIMADVVDLEEEPTTNEPQQFSSPEVQFIGTQIRPVEEGRQNENNRRNREAPPIFRRSNLEDMMRRISANGPPSSYLQRQQQTIREEMGLRSRNLARSFPATIASLWIGAPPQVEVEDDFPIELNYRTAGFESGETRRTPAYVAPSAPPPGFTTTVGENEVVVCPNCDHELGTGDDADQRQIWVAKPCGHVYCGQCTKNRARSRKRADSAISPKTKPFAKCVVPDCGKTVSQPKAMFQIFL